VTYHLLPVFDVSEACFLLRGEPALAKKLRGLPRYALKRLAPGTWWIEPDHGDEVRAALAPIAACATCAAGTPCEVWKDFAFVEHTPRRPEQTEPEGERVHVFVAVPPAMTRAEAQRILGVTDACSNDTIRRAFRDAVHAAHPDTGGDPAVVSSLLTKLKEARKVLGCD